MLENIVFERDYETERKNRVNALPKIESEIFDYSVQSGFFKAYSDAMRALPKYIVPEDKEAYDNLLPRLDEVAKKWGGKIKGVVDYERWESYITVILPFFECSTAEDQWLLVDIATKADMFNISATEDGNVRLYIMINYFDEIGDKENLLEETILKDDKLVALLEEQHEQQKKNAFSNPAIAAFLEKNASSMGMTADELYEMIDQACNTNPDLINQMFFGHKPEEDEDEK